MIDIFSTSEKVGEVLASHEVLTQKSNIIPDENFQALVDANLYNHDFLHRAGKDFVSILVNVFSGCPATGLVWAQHAKSADQIMKSPNRILQEKYVRDLQNSKLKISVTYQGLKSQDFLFTRQDDEIHISGVAHYISGWKYTDLLCIYARNKDFLDELVMFIVDREVLKAVRIEELELISVNPSSTVKAHFDELPVYEENICRSLSIPLPHEKKLESTVPNLAMGIAVVKKFYQYMEKTRGEKT